MKIWTTVGLFMDTYCTFKQKPTLKCRATALYKILCVSVTVSQSNFIWAVTWENAPCVVHRTKTRISLRIRTFVSMKKLCILGYPKCAQWRFWSDCANAQADLNLRWAHISKLRFLPLQPKLYTCPITSRTFNYSAWRDFLFAWHSYYSWKPIIFTFTELYI